MNKSFYIVMLLLVSNPGHAAFFGLFGTDNFYECILDDMPGEKSHSKAKKIYKSCQQQHQKKDLVEKQRPWLFGPKNVQECLAEDGEDYKQAGIMWIREACYKLYYFK